MNQEVGVEESSAGQGGNYTYYDASIELPRVDRFSTSPRRQKTEIIQKEYQPNTFLHHNNSDRTIKDHANNYEQPVDLVSLSESLQSPAVNKRNEGDFADKRRENGVLTHHDKLKSKGLSFIDDCNNDNNDNNAASKNTSSNKDITNTSYERDDKPLFVPCPPSKPKPNGTIIRAQVHPKPRHELKDGAINQHSSGEAEPYSKRLPPLESDNKDRGKEKDEPFKNKNKSLSSPCLNGTPQSKSSAKMNDSKSLTRDKMLIEQYKELLNERFHKDYSSESGGENEEDDDFSISVSSLSSDEEQTDNDDDLLQLENQTLTQSKFEPLYSLPIKDKKKNNSNNKGLNSILISNASLGGTYKRTGSLPDMRSIVDMSLKRVSHVTKNESEAESEPGAKIRYKFKPLPPIPGTLSNINNSGLYETIDGLSKLNTADSTRSKDSNNKRKTFKDIATILTLVPRLTTNSVRSRKNDHRLAEISQYIPDKKLKVFVGTWNMKGTKFLPASLDDFLLPPESIYLQDIYVIGTQEGTPFRREWQVRLQETFGPSHVLMQASNFGVLQLSIFVRRELVWFCSSVEQDTIATRVGHKIKTKGALAMSFSIFGTSFLFLTSHFTSDKEKLSQRINDYRTICRNIQLPAGDGKYEEADVTNRFDRVFWFGDFNFRIQKSRDVVDRIMKRHARDQPTIVQELLQHDQLNEIFDRGKIFHGFKESDVRFMPTYKFDVNTDTYDTSHKKRVPSWTDRIVFKTRQDSLIKCLHYNSCNTIKVSDHRAVYAIFETQIEPYQNNFTVPGANFDREIYVEANLRRNAPAGSQDNSHVCTIL